jgi:hypothetical protein
MSLAAGGTLPRYISITLEQGQADLFPLSPHWKIFPALQAVAGPLTERHLRFVMVLDLAPGQWIDTVHQRRPPRVIVLDMDSSESPTLWRTGS